ncbi:MAG: hypothetical protein ACK452_06575 [Bacteroidota bacterium]
MKHEKENIAALYFALNTAPESRSYFIRKFSKIENSEKIINAKTNEFVYSKFSVKIFIKLNLWFLIWILAIIFSIFKKRKYDSLWTVEVFTYGVQAILLSGQKNKYIFFVALSPISVLLAYFVSEILTEQVILISSNSPMYRPMRYTWLPNAELKVCSDLLLEEWRAYTKLNWMKFKNADVWGLEEVDEVDKISDKKVLYDIGIYSSAEWARNNYYWRETDLQKVKNYTNVNQFIYKVFDDWILDTVIDVGKTKNLSCIVYPHPYERYLKSKYNLDPPYLDKLKKEGVAFDYEENSVNTVSKIYQAKVGIAESSTIIMDRWHLGLKAFIFSGKNYEKEFNVDYNYNYLFSHKEDCFHDKLDLRNKLLSFF